MLSQKKMMTIALFLNGSKAMRLAHKNKQDDHAAEMDADIQHMIDEMAAEDMHPGHIEGEEMAQLVSRALEKSKLSQLKSAPPPSGGGATTIQGPSNVYGVEQGECRLNGSGNDTSGTYRVNSQVNEGTCVDICD